MRLNIKSLFRAALQIGGGIAASGVITGHSLDVLTQVLGFAGIAGGVIWGQVNATQQHIVQQFVKAAN